MSLFVENGVLAFLILTVIIGGGLAYMAGRGLASKWRPVWMAVAYMVPLGLAVRFLHYALLGNELTSLHYFITHTVVLIAAALLGYRITRVNQMVRQYPWLYERSGPLAWKAR